MPSQSEMGKAFEYAVLKSIYNELSENQLISIVDNGSLTVAKDFYDGVSDDFRRAFDIAALAANGQNGIKKIVGDK